MKNKIKYINLCFAIAFLLLSSCNYKVTNKKYIVKDVKGYLVFREEESIFFPYNDTIDIMFLADKNKKEGYKIGYDTYWFDSLSIDYSQLKNAEGYKVKFSIIPVEIRYYLGDVWMKKDEINTMYYKWNNEIMSLRFKQHDWRNIISIFLLRKGDQEREAQLNIDRPPLHYRQ
jgi:hypothetical protein